MTVRCIAGAEDNTHPFSLTGLDADGNTITVGLIPVDNKGKDSIHSVRYSRLPNQYFVASLSPFISPMPPFQSLRLNSP